MNSTPMSSTKATYEAPRIDVIGEVHALTQGGFNKTLGHSDSLFFQPAVSNLS
jgi:hypothetical protein